MPLRAQTRLELSRFIADNILAKDRLLRQFVKRFRATQAGLPPSLPCLGFEKKYP